MAHRRGSFGRGRGISQAQRRKKSWIALGTSGSETIGVTLSTAAPAIGAPTVVVIGIDSTNATLGGLLEGTILRLRGSVDLPKSTTGSASGNSVMAIGMGFVTDEAFFATAVPNPATIDGANWDGWLYYRSNLQAPVDSNGGIVDNKAMRKWNSGMTLAIIAGQATDAAAGQVSQTARLIARMLFLLP